MISYVSAHPLVDALEQADSDSVQGIEKVNELKRLIELKEEMVQLEKQMLSQISELLYSISIALANWKEMCDSEGWDWTRDNERLIVNVDIILHELSLLGYQVSF
jgi:hypothetical protein